MNIGKKRKTTWSLAVIFFIASATFGQSKQKIDSVKFFKENDILEMTLTTDIPKMKKEKGDDVYQPAVVSLVLGDKSVIEETITVAPRGHFRRENCDIPPIMVDFSNPTSPRLSPLGKLKLVIGCGSRGNDEQLVLGEYLAYKAYNILEEKSFRVRLLKVTYKDSRNKVRSFSQYAFLIEDDKAMAKRNNCTKYASAQVGTESTDRPLMTKVAIFEYMISNGDWSVPYSHNIRLMTDKKNKNALPYPVPYDFDHSGFVNADYATPNELLGTETVTERVYRGFPRMMEELETAFAVFRSKKESIMSLINSSLLTDRNKKELVSYLEEFYKTINNKKEVQRVFIDNARTK